MLMLLKAIKSHSLNQIKTRHHHRLFTRCCIHHRFSATRPRVVLPRSASMLSVTCTKIQTHWCSTNALPKDECNEENEVTDTIQEVEDANVKCRGSLEIQKTNGQWGVHTTRAFSKGELVISSNLKYSTTTSCAHSIQIGWGEHVLMDLPGRYLNHSCDPNIGVRGLNERNSYDFVALKDLDVNEELTFDYETTEYDIGAFSKCLCGSWNCRGKVCGFKYNGDTIRKKYDAENIASYLL